MWCVLTLCGLQDWASVLPTLKLTTEGNWTEVQGHQGVALYPPKIEGRTAGFMYNLHDFLIDLESSRVAVGGGGELTVEGKAVMDRG